MINVWLSLDARMTIFGINTEETELNDIPANIKIIIRAGDVRGDNINGQMR